ncbi:hypothetical protein [Rubritalea tangerina]|uniref:hypothetical protein n=1 Tax=Rubritalea tangerina TaxID=430798 RepID=UPI00361C0BE2
MLKSTEYWLGSKMETRKQSWGYWALLIWGGGEGTLFYPWLFKKADHYAVDYYKWLPVAIIAAVLLFFRAMRASQPAVVIAHFGKSELVCYLYGWLGLCLSL